MIQKENRLTSNNFHCKQYEDSEPIKHIMNCSTSKSPTELVLVCDLSETHDGIRY